MSRWLIPIFLVCLVLMALWLFVGQGMLTAVRPGADLLTQSQVLFGSLPDRMPGSEHDTPELVALGRRLFFEQEISAERNQSCNDCHQLDWAGNDALPVSTGSRGLRGDRNAPTVFNAGFQIAQFWDGRAETLEEQAKGPLLNPVEMAMESGKQVEQRLREAGYAEAFDRAFGTSDGSSLTFDNVARALAAFQRTLITRGRFDRFIAGDRDALTEVEKEGLQTFISVGCIQCHNGPLLGGRLFQRLGIFEPYLRNREDTGRKRVTEFGADLYVFKVAPLRHVTETAPYFHDGRVQTLEESIELMGRLQLKKKLTPEQVSSIAAFLRTLTPEAETQSVATGQ